MRDLVNPALSVVLVVISICMVVWGVQRILNRRSGESRKKDSFLLLALTVAATSIMLWLYLTETMRPGYLLLFIPMVIIIPRFAWVAARPFTQADAIQNFATDSRKCGQCEYDLTGNTSGICPECGWKIPAGELLAEDPDWVAWWRQWRIRYLRDWLWHLTSYIGMSLLLFALSAYFYMQGHILPLVLFTPLAVHLGINAVRVAMYVSRMRGERGLRK